jgi:hypothetical protein
LTSIIYYREKSTGNIVGSDQFDGRGRATNGFRPEFYNDSGRNNPNIQLNYTLKPEYEAISIGTNTDNFLQNNPRGGYIWDERSNELFDDSVITPITKYQNKLNTYEYLKQHSDNPIDPDIPDLLQYQDVSDYKTGIIKDKLKDIESQKEKRKKDKKLIENLTKDVEQNKARVNYEEWQDTQIRKEQKPTTTGKQFQYRARQGMERKRAISSAKMNLARSEELLYNATKPIEDEQPYLESLKEIQTDFNPNYDYEKLSDLRNLIAIEQNKKIDEISTIEDPLEKQRETEKLPFYNFAYDDVSEKLSNLELRINEKRKDITMQIDPDLPELGDYNDTSDYEKLYGLQDVIISEQNKRFEEINLLQDPAERFVRKEKDLKQYGDYLNFANEKITNLDARVENVRGRRKPSEISFSDIGDSFTYNKLVDERNIIASLQNEKVAEINLIQDPAERYVAIEQDFPIISGKLNEYDENINKYGNILETRTPIDIKFERDRKGSLEINIGDNKRKFRNTRRGIMEAEQFYTQSRKKHFDELPSDKIIKNASLEQDMPLLDYGEKALKEQKKAQKIQDRQRQLNMQDSFAGDFGPNAPSTTPTGTLRVPTPKANTGRSGGFEKMFTNNEIRFPDMNEKRSKPFSRQDRGDFGGTYDYFTPKSGKKKSFGFF